ncbi:MAG: MFS transporter [Chloroflexi bacterium]|jgi:MFS family permease|nr:MFS transporter [Chloroflexota bacterium]MBT4002979.1 MFS transporter [Chloroflexota bacterium]MBT4305819.1 MFS transporter [Chloroflexota bacterium]MBT4533643.1 MFS transporter [Chloroflexota bacterium]MBT4681714.1 MFS transporter [Chloroflexota bacterium]
MTEKGYKVYGYRWVILIVFMLVNIAIQILWISFASIGGEAANFYGVTDLNIGFLSMIFMVVYVPLSIPVSWLIDKWGFKKAVGLGALIMSVFGLLRGIYADEYSLVVITTIGIAVSQPFFLNAFTTVAAKWFSIDERAIASGLATVAMFVGIAIGMVLTPILILDYDIPTAQLSYGIVAILTSLTFWIFTKEAPPTPPCPPEQEERALMMDGLKSMLKMKDIWYLMSVFLVGMGIFNGISTWIESIARPKGFSITEAGELGAFFLVGGVLGAIVLPALSDKFRKRKPVMLAGMLLAIPGLIGVTFATSYSLMVISILALGFFMVGLAPVGYQYGAEITYPSPEGTSNGLMVLAGQVSVVFVYGMELLKGDDGTFTISLLMFIVLMGISAFLISRLTESTMIEN